MHSTPAAAKTVSAVISAGSDRAWVSMPMKSGPVMPLAARCSTMDAAMARMWASLKLPLADVPRWPEVPNDTAWSGSEASGESA